MNEAQGGDASSPSEGRESNEPESNNDPAPSDDGDDDGAPRDGDPMADDDFADDDGPDDLTPSCGDGLIQAGEECEDRNAEPGDGCSECRVEPGWECSGTLCSTVCGDGLIVVSREQCDDGNTAPGDGCDALCRVEGNCGNGALDDGEECDDGNQLDADGCDARCAREGPRCLGAECFPTICGDGALGAGEECDDGNTESGDGCDATCSLESVSCVVVDDSNAPFIELPIVYRDFYGVGSDSALVAPNPAGHPDFENEDFSLNSPKVEITSAEGVPFNDIAGPTVGLVHVALGEGQVDALANKPTFNSTGSPRAQLTDAVSFHQWFVDVPGVNVTLGDVLRLNAGSDEGSFDFHSSDFYPMDDLGLTAPSAPSPGPEPLRPTDWLSQGCGAWQADGRWENISGGSHNYSFTTEVRFSFEFQGGEQLSFTGDDDAWVFVNGKLVIDLGGLHEPFYGDLCGNTASILEVQPSCGGLATTSTDVLGNPLELAVGEVYEIAIFQAERHTCVSNYTLRLSGFRRATGNCF